MEALELEIYQHYARQLPPLPSLRASPPKRVTLQDLSSQYDAFFFDGFGTLYNLTEKHEGSAEALGILRKQNKKIRLVTNAASRPVFLLKQHLDQMGIHFEQGEILCSGDLFAQENLQWGIRSAFHLGRLEAESFLRDAGVSCSENPQEPVVVVTSGSPQDAALLGGGLEATLRVAQEIVVKSTRSVAGSRGMQAREILLQQGARLIVLNPDAWAPKLDGTRIPVSGALAWSLHQQTGCALHCLGKPFPQIFRRTMESVAVPSERCIMIGDTLGTDILGAQRSGLATALLLRGNTDPVALEADQIALGVVPDFYLDRI